MKKLFIASLVLWVMAIRCSNTTDEARLENMWSVKMADAVMERFDTLIYYNHSEKVKWQYDIAMLGQAIDRLGDVDLKYSKYHEDFINYFIQENGAVNQYNQEDYNLDHVNPAKGLITLYKRTGEEKYLLAINAFIKQLENQPRTKNGGFWHKKRYPYQMWLDGVYMSAPFMAQYAIEFNQPQWLDSVAKQIVTIYNATLDENTGLLYHAWDESRQQQWSHGETGRSPHFWGRAMGWYMMALVDVLDFIPENYKQKDTLVNILNATSHALIQVRDADTGLWYQVLDKGGEAGNYLEASASSMFVYAFAKGAKKGYLPAEYLDVANNSFESVVANFISTGKDHHPVMKNICGAAGLGGDPYRDGSYNYYITEKIVENDPKGVAPFILASLELGR
jgi:unsaturated rhamnogalacturonyl hydrolase